MIPNKTGWHYLEVTKFHALLRGITSKTNDDFYYMNCLYSLEQKLSPNLIWKYEKIKSFVEL